MAIRSSKNKKNSKRSGRLRSNKFKNSKKYKQLVKIQSGGGISGDNKKIFHQLLRDNGINIDETKLKNYLTSNY